LLIAKSREKVVVVISVVVMVMVVSVVVLVVVVAVVVLGCWTIEHFTPQEPHIDADAA
jgi:hypothetical protein